MRVNVGDKVRVDASMGYLSNVMGVTGEVIQIYEFLVPMAVVKFENGVTAKVEVSNLRKVEAQENAEPKSEIPEGAKQITKADFEAALKRVTSPDHVLGDNSRDPMGGLMRSITTMIVGKKVTDKIFENQNAVVMTEDEFISALWEACNPNSVAEAVEKKMSVRKCITVAMTAIISFEEIVEILFGGSND